ncbi:ESX secretion-associated protein EspG [Skermania piniformis]|uniref:ESX secretion-associated protein EspG n=1 Tax=Skermania pinensis TaxID=39122 RepID=A0ABX8S8G6_9ACTN|nr:ESX secretion-associated protein EspG [Skermania piniformis]QXQ12795.1 ESX secretion-associated protein EspG [Skermania piniformis]
MTAWTFHPLTYQVGWRSFGADPPYPFQYRSTTSEMARYTRQCISASEQFEDQLDEALYQAFVVMMNPDVRIHVCGLVGPGDADKVRLYAAMRGADAVLAQQNPGAGRTSGGSVRVTRVQRVGCGDAVARALPNVRAGTQKRIDVDHDELPAGDGPEPRATSWLRPADAGPTPVADATRLLARPRTGIGRIEVYPGASLGARDTGDGRDVRWLDVLDDGRYLLVDRARSISISPGGPAALRDVVQELIAPG